MARRADVITARRYHHKGRESVIMPTMDDTLAAKLLVDATTSLADQKHALKDAVDKVPDEPGLYALYGSAEVWIALGLGQAPAGAALFVGKADESLKTRDLETHFRSGRTGQSTVRRSFAALLRDDLGLRGVPRNQTKPERFDEFALSVDDDEQLSVWMNAHLEIAVWAKPPDCTNLGAVEIAVLKRWSPPLNLRDNRSTWGARLTAARKVMANDARTWARDRGHKL